MSFRIDSWVSSVSNDTPDVSANVPYNFGTDEEEAFDEDVWGLSRQPEASRSDSKPNQFKSFDLGNGSPLIRSPHYQSGSIAYLHEMKEGYRSSDGFPDISLATQGEKRPYLR